jgi:hypothetical protein
MHTMNRGGWTEHCVVNATRHPDRSCPSFTVTMNIG